MLDPGSCLAIVSLALEAAKGILAYYELWNDCDNDVGELQRSLLWLTNLFTQLDITLKKPNLQEEIVSVIRLTVKGCEGNISKLQSFLDKIRKEDSLEGLRAKFKTANRRTLYIFHNKAIKSLKEVLAELKNDLKLAIDLLDLNTSATSLNELRDLQTTLSVLKATIDDSNQLSDSITQKRRLEEKRAEILAWLAPCNVSISHLSALEKHFGSMETWAVVRPYCAWSSASIIEEVKRRKSISAVPDNIVYFYFAFDNTQRQDLWGFLKSALTQLCDEDSTPPQLASLFRSCNPDLPSLKELQITFLEVLQDLCEVKPSCDVEHKSPASGKNSETQEPNHTYIVMDGLDEIPYGSHRQVVLGFLRLERDIEAAFEGYARWRSLRIAQKNVEADMDIYVTNQIAKTPKLQSQIKSIKAAIKEKLVVRAGGMFRWTALQIEELKNRRVLRGREIMNILSSLPPDLDATYERILANIDPAFVYEATTALQWLLCATRPLYVEELAEACIVRPNDSNPVEDDQRLSPLDILEILPGLLRVEPAQFKSDPPQRRTHSISLSHFSVKEYLPGERILRSTARNFSINIEVAQNQIARSCLAYVAHCRPLRFTYNDASHPLWLYTHSRWPLHVSLVPNSSIEEVCIYAIELFKRPQLCLRWIEYTSMTRRMLSEKNKPYYLELPHHLYTNSEWPLHYLLLYSIASGNKTSVQILLGSELQIQSSYLQGYPLKLAVRYGHRAIVQLLLNTGVDASGVIVAALKSGHEEITKILLERGVQINGAALSISAQCSSPSVFQHLSANTSRLRMIEILEALDAAIGSCQYENARALFGALLGGKLHLQQKANIQCHNSETLLYHRIFKNVIKLDSSRVLLFILRYVSKDILDSLDTEALFLQSVVQGNDNATKALSNYPWFSISEKVRILAAHWKRVTIHDHVSLSMIAIYKWYLRNDIRMPENSLAADTTSNWELLHTFEPAVANHYARPRPIHGSSYSSWITNIKASKTPQKIYEHGQRRLSSRQRIKAYMIMSGPHSSFIRDIYAVQSLRQSTLQSPMRSALSDVLVTSDHPHQSFLSSIPWRKYLDHFLAGRGRYREMEIQTQKTQFLEGFSLELCGIHTENLPVNSVPLEIRLSSYAAFQYQFEFLKGTGQLELNTESSTRFTRLIRSSELFKHFSIYLKARKSGKDQNCLQQNLPYHVVIQGITSPYVLHNRDSRWLPVVIVYEEIMRVDLFFDSEGDLSRWFRLVHHKLDSANFCPTPLLWETYLLDRDQRIEDSKTPMTLFRSVETDLKYCSSIQEDEKMVARSCVRYLEVILQMQEAGWTMKWSQIPSGHGIPTKFEADIHLNESELSSRQICEELSEYGISSGATQTLRASNGGSAEVQRKGKPDFTFRQS